MTTCDRCGREAEGFAVIGERRLCHPDYGSSCGHLEPDTETVRVAEVLYGHPDLLSRYIREWLVIFPVVHVRRGTDRWYLEVAR